MVNNKYFFCLDADDELYDFYSLESLYKYAEKEKVGIVQGETITLNNDNSIIKEP